MITLPFLSPNYAYAYPKLNLMLNLILSYSVIKNNKIYNCFSKGFLTKSEL